MRIFRLRGDRHQPVPIKMDGAGRLRASFREAGTETWEPPIFVPVATDGTAVLELPADRLGEYWVVMEYSNGKNYYVSTIQILPELDEENRGNES